MAEEQEEEAMEVDEKCSSSGTFIGQISKRVSVVGGFWTVIWTLFNNI
jgi:hypothetical protein